MPLIHRPSADRGLTQLDWLTSRHTFNFGQYRSLDYVNYGPIRAINDDIIAPGQGFPLHRQHNMEILTYVLSGQLEHRDSLGHTALIEAGHFQLTSAGQGIAHSENNRSSKMPVHLLQIWIEPDTHATAPTYAHLRSSLLDQLAGWRMIARKSGGPDILSIRQDVNIWAGFVHTGAPSKMTLRPHRAAWIHVVSGQLNVALDFQTISIRAGDGLAVSEEQDLILTTSTSGQVLIFDIPDPHSL